MLLASEVFNAVVQSLGADSPTGSLGQRREPRLSLRTRLTLLPCPDGVDVGIGPALSVPVRDLSRGGLRFLLPRRVPLDSQFVLLLPDVPSAPTMVSESGPADGPLALVCTVAYWQPLAKGLFAIGGQFLRPLIGGQFSDLAPRVVLPDQTAEDALPLRAAS